MAKSKNEKRRARNKTRKRGARGKRQSFREGLKEERFGVFGGSKERFGSMFKKAKETVTKSVGLTPKTLGPLTESSPALQKVLAGVQRISAGANLPKTQAMVYTNLQKLMSQILKVDDPAKIDLKKKDYATLEGILVNLQKRGEKPSSLIRAIKATAQLSLGSKGEAATSAAAKKSAKLVSGIKPGFATKARGFLARSPNLAGFGGAVIADQLISGVRGAFSERRENTKAVKDARANVLSPSEILRQIEQEEALNQRMARVAGGFPEELGDFGQLLAGGGAQQEPLPRGAVAFAPQGESPSGALPEDLLRELLSQDG